jgi:hypothetical protein
MKAFKSALAIAGVVASSFSFQIFAEGNNGIIAIPYEGSNTLVIVDTNSKKMLVYSVSERNGLSLKEVRSFEEALQVKNIQTSKGISGASESKELAKYIVK